ncbi:cerebellin 18 [Pseudochaenichthys georgianus]|uniref:cerebellin 18 n=1 Tax=Pseudochaenichthys georgianus TaxID=52239 RepID=UPI00146B7AF8|nr:cerebellin-2 [Pseudochaenichthys georgianus]
MVVLPVLFLLGPLCLSGPAEALTVAETLKEAALNLDKPLDCNTWDCKCAFEHQRGCCCATKDMFQLEDDSFMRTKHLWFNISALKYRVKELTGGVRVAFKASNIASSTAPGSSDTCFGPFNTNVPIPYNHVTLNHNNGYNPALGVFTAPAAGVYVFSFSVFSQENGRLYYQVQLMKNGERIVGVWENNRQDPEDNANQNVVLELQRGDQVYIELMSGRKLCKFLAENIFTGYMLYPHTNPYIDMYEY